MFKHTIVPVLLFLLLCIPMQSDAAGDDSETMMLKLGAVSSYLARTYDTRTTPLTSNELRNSITAGVRWFKAAQEESGHFRYEYVPYTGTYREDDNIVRQAGALYALGEIFREDTNNTLKLSTTIEKSIGYFESLTRSDERGGKEFSCITRSTSSIRCPLGATSLALIGILSYIDDSPSAAREYRDLVLDYRTYILAMQKENGGFRDLHSVGSTKTNDAESSFSNGEALLALVRAYRYSPDAETKQAIDRTFTYLAAQPFDANLYLWIMAAVKDMESLWPRDEYVSYAKNFTEWRLDRGAGSRNSKRNYCAYAEGLASAATILKGKVSVASYTTLQNELDRLNRNHRALQLTNRDTYRIISPNNIPQLAILKDAGRAVGGFLTEDSEPTQRIDFTQHCLGAYVQTLTGIRGEQM